MRAEEIYLNEGEAVYMRAWDEPSLRRPLAKGIRPCMLFVKTQIPFMAGCTALYLCPKIA